jgi:hypothetical protein
MEERKAGRMDDRRYADTQNWLVIMASLVATLDLDGFLQWIERAETLGPILSPTLYVQASGKLDNAKRLAEAAKVLQDEVKRQVTEGQSGRNTG